MSDALRGRVRALLLAAVLCALPAAAHAQTRLTAGSSVRLRAGPDTAATVLARLPLGTELRQSDASPDSAWIRVSTADGRHGWLRAALTVEVPDSGRERVAAEIIQQRLARADDGFDGHAELVAFIEHALASASSRAAAARLAFYRLQALQAAAGTIPFLHTWSDALIAWVAAHEDELAYNEPGGEWLVRRDVILAVHDRFRDTDVADSIAWLAVTVGVPGECEGYLACYVAWADLLEGEYLRRQPRGAFVDEAVDRLADRLSLLAGPAEFYFDAEEDCPDLATLSRSLRAAVAPVTAARRAEVIRIVETLGGRCANGRK